MVVVAACTPQPDRHVDAGELADAGVDDRVDDECATDDDCAAFVDCLAGVCDSEGHDCYAERDCGRHFTCQDGVCVDPDPATCDLPCCRDWDCGLFEACTAFRCVPRSCVDDWDCAWVNGGTPVYGCYDERDCPDGAWCINFDPNQCFFMADASCEAEGNVLRVFLAPDGAMIPLCVEIGSCAGGACESPS